MHMSIELPNDFFFLSRSEKTTPWNAQRSHLNSKSFTKRVSIIRPEWLLGKAYYLSIITTPNALSMHACGAEVEWSASAAMGQLKRDHIWGREIEGEPIDFESLTKFNLTTKQERS